MTADQKFFKEAHIEPCEIVPRWMEWRGEELAKLRLEVATWTGYTHEQFGRAERWKLIAFAGWFLAAIVLMSTIIERAG